MGRSPNSGGDAVIAPKALPPRVDFLDATVLVAPQEMLIQSSGRHRKTASFYITPKGKEAIAEFPVLLIGMRDFSEMPMGASS